MADRIPIPAIRSCESMLRCSVIIFLSLLRLLEEKEKEEEDEEDEDEELGLKEGFEGSVLKNA